jgi:hypothetical protein
LAEGRAHDWRDSLGWTERKEREGWAGMGRSSRSQGIEILSNFKRNLEFGNTLEIYTKGFRRNLDMRIFPKIF